MPIIYWNRRFSIGVPQIDNHHRHLFFLLNKLYDNCIYNAPIQDMNELFYEIINYTTSNFAMEELMMQDNWFPGFERHKVEHDMFSKRIMAIDHQHYYDKRHALIDSFVLLHNWIQAHIITADAEFGFFIVSRKKALVKNSETEKTNVLCRRGDFIWNNLQRAVRKVIPGW